MLHGNVVVPHGLCGFLRSGKKLLHPAGDVKLISRAAGAGHGGELFHRGVCGGVKAFYRHAKALEKLRHKAAVLPQQGQQQVHLLQLLILMGDCKLLRAAQGFQTFLRILIQIHNESSFLF